MSDPMTTTTTTTATRGRWRGTLLALVILAAPIAAAGLATASHTPEQQIIIFYEGAWTQTEDALSCGWGFVTYTGEQSNQNTVVRLGQDGEANTLDQWHAAEGLVRPYSDDAAGVVAWLWGPGADSASKRVNDTAHDVKCLIIHGVLVPVSELLIWENPPVACFAKSTTTCGGANIDCNVFYAFDLAFWVFDPGAGPYPRACTPPGVPTTPVTREESG